MKPFLLGATFSLFAFCVYSQITFEKTYMKYGYQSGNSVVQTNDGGYAIVGSSGWGTGTNDVFLIKTNEFGDTVWTKTYGGSDDDFGYKMIQLGSGSFIICGTTKSFGNGNEDVYLLKTNSIGNVIWEKTYGGALADRGGDFVQTSDGGFIICGTTRSFGAGEADIYVIRTNLAGDTLWTKTYGGQYWDHAGPIIRTIDGGYLFGASVTYNSLGHNSMKLFNIDDNGIIIWTKEFKVGKWNHPASIIQTSDSCFLIAGHTNTNNWYPYLLKLNSSGDTIWTKVFYMFNYSGFATSVVENDDGSFMVGGYYSPVSDTYINNIYLMKINSFGDTLWMQTYNNSNGDNCSDLIRTNDNGYVLSGKRSIPANSPSDVLLIKLGPNGLTTVPENFNENSLVSFYPNPTTGLINLRVQSQFDQIQSLEVFNYLGQLILRKTENYHETDFGSLSNGIYFIVLTNLFNEKQTVKVVKH